MTATNRVARSGGGVTSALGVLFPATAVATGLAAGFFFAYAANVTLALGSLSGPAYTGVMQPINETVRNAAFATAFFGPVVATVVGVVVLALRREVTTRYGVLFLAGGVLYVVGTVAVTATIHVPMNEYIATWSSTQPPADWEAVRTRWARWNLVRTVAALGAFVSFIVATIARTAPSGSST